MFVTHSVYESVYLSDRIVIMAPRPGRIVAEVNVPAPLPREEDFRLGPTYADAAARLPMRCMRRWVLRRAARRERANASSISACRSSRCSPRSAFWEAIVRINDIPPVILPAPSQIFLTLIKDWGTLSKSLMVTLGITLEALIAATIGGSLLALAFAQWRPVERAFFPFAVILQVTPVVSIAPLLLVYLSSGAAVLVCAFLVAFFPILSNTALGLSSVDHNLLDLFQLYRASRGRQLLLLRIPSALPYFLGGLRIGGGLALIGAIVAEIAAGSAGQGAGLAFRIVRVGLPPQYPPHVRRAGIDFRRRHHDLRRAERPVLSVAASLARQRPKTGDMSARFHIAAASRWALVGARVLKDHINLLDAPTDSEGFAKVDMVVDGGRIAAIAPEGALDLADTPRLPLGGRIVLPTFIDAHTHLDKGQIWRRAPNPSGDFNGAIETVKADREANWSAADVATRLEFALRSAYAHGTRAIRTHLDSIRGSSGHFVSRVRGCARALARAH